MSTQPFMPQGNTVAITSALTSTAAVQVGNAQGTGGQGPSQYYINVVGAVPMFFSFGTASSGTAPAAVIPTNGSPANGFPVYPGIPKVITGPPGAWVATIASATTSVGYITPGDGM